MKYLVIASFLAGLLALNSCKEAGKRKAVEYTADWESLVTHPTPEWFMDGKLGIYFHWGVYSVPAYGTEWYPRHMYLEDHRGLGAEIRPYHLDTYGADFQ